MNAVAETHGVEDGALMSLNAGASTAMVCHTPAKPKGAVGLVRAVVTNGRLSLDSLRESHDHITGLKSEFAAGSWLDLLHRVFGSGVRFSSYPKMSPCQARLRTQHLRR